MDLSSDLSLVAKRLLQRAQRETQSGDAQAAWSTMASVLALAPDNPDVLRAAGIAAQNVGDHAAAAAHFERALATAPDDVDLHIGLGVALYRSGREDEALTHLRRACELAPGSASAWYNLAEALKPRVRTQEAIEALQRTLTIEPGHTRARLGLARALVSVGRIDAAAIELREIVRHNSANADAWSALANLKTVSLDDGDAHQLALALEQPGLSPEARTRLEFVLARALEDTGDYAGAWRVLVRANAAQRARVHWDGANEHRRVEAILRVFSKRPVQATDPELGREIIFIASLPRSGSTLVEQILASHSEVTGANEIGDLAHVIDVETQRVHGAFPLWVPVASAADWQRLGEAYLARTARWRADKPRMVDKNLLNWMLAGAALSMLPGARVVVVRRDPLETCLACYRQWFDDHGGYSYDLDDLVDLYGDFLRLTRFWLDTFRGRVLDLEYERLVAEPEPAIRRLLDFCGLSFDPACLHFYETPRTVLSAPSAAQVRQPLHATARAARYGHLLDGLRKRLRDAGLGTTPPV